MRSGYGVRPAGGEGKARVGDGQREEGRWSLSFNAWIAIAVGLLVVVVVGLHAPVYLRYRHERKVAVEVAHVGGYAEAGRHAPPWPMSLLADRWKEVIQSCEAALAIRPGSTEAKALLSQAKQQIEKAAPENR